MPRNRGRSAELGDSAHADDGQTGIRRSRPRARRSRICRAEPDAAWMKTLVLQEKSFCKTVPAQAGFVLKPRRNDRHVRKRNELYARGCDGVEARELPAGCGQGQGKGLRAVAEEVSAGQNVILAEVVVNLGNNAAQVVRGRGNYRSVRARTAGDRGGDVRRRPRMPRQQALNHGIRCVAGTEGTVSRRPRWHTGERHHPHPFALPFVINEKERLILRDGTAQRAAKLVVVKARLWLTDRVEIIAGIQGIIPEIL